MGMGRYGLGRSLPSLGALQHNARAFSSDLDFTTNVFDKQPYTVRPVDSLHSTQPTAAWLVPHERSCPPSARAHTLANEPVSLRDTAATTATRAYLPFSDVRRTR